ncbi:MAG: response regulator [Gammaproteobacteria bacterium]|nr:response regulator [Gammaproteobacteria bacterium]
MALKKTSSINFKINIATLLVICSVFLFLYVALSQYVRDYVDISVSNLLDQRLHQIDHDLDAEREEVIRVVQSLATNPVVMRAVDRQSARGVSQHLNRMIQIHPYFSHIFLLDNYREILAVNTRDGLGHIVDNQAILGEELTTFTQLAKRFNSDQSITIVLDDPFAEYVGYESSKVEVFFWKIRKGADTVGWVGAIYLWQTERQLQFEDILLNAVKMNEYLSAISISDNSNVLVSAFAEDYKPELVDNYLQKSMRLNDEANIQLNISIDYFKASHIARDISQWILIAFVIALPLTFFLLYSLFLHLVTRRIISIVNAVNTIKDGDLQEDLPSLGNDELGALIHGVDEMREALRQSHEELESRIEARTQELNISRQHLTSITDNAPQLLSYIDNQKNYIFVNKAFEKWFEKPMESFIGRHISDGMGESAYEKLQPFIDAALAGEQVDFEAEVLYIAGGTRYIHATYSPDFDSHEPSKVKGYFSSIEDITSIKASEVAMQESKLIAENAALTKSEFLASMSHEIRTPMNGVLGMLGILAKSKLDEKQSRQVHLAETSAQALLSIINDILDFSKIEAGKLDFEDLDFDLRKVLDEFAEAQALKAIEKNIELIVDTSEIQYSRVVGDPGRLRQILYNLVGNAFKFTEEGEIILRAAIHDSEEFGHILTCSIRDTGVGISKEKQASLFDAFTQADSSTTRKYGGTGLGLSITKQLCELMGGSVCVTSAPGEGACFEFSVNLKRSETAMVVLPPCEIEKLRILIVDDNETNLEVLNTQLTIWGATVIQARSAEQAWTILNQRAADTSGVDIDLAVLDMQMPDCDGTQLGERIRSVKKFDSIKLIIMTSMTHRGDAAHFADLGFQGYVSKPVTTNDLFKIVNIFSNGSSDFSIPSSIVTNHALGSVGIVGDAAQQEDLALFAAEKRILLVEDNAINQEFAKLILVDDFGFTLDVAGNGLEALHMVRSMSEEIPYDVILMDCQMPEMDGYEATRAIRAGHAGEKNKAISIIAMTANAMKGDKENCLAAGMDDYVSKPVDPDVLIEAIKKVLNGKPQVDSAIPDTGELVTD